MLIKSILEQNQYGQWSIWVSVSSNLVPDTRPETGDVAHNELITEVSYKWFHGTLVSPQTYYIQRF